MMEGVFINRKKFTPIIERKQPFKKENNIAKDVRGSISPEVFLYNILF